MLSNYLNQHCLNKEIYVLDKIVKHLLSELIRRQVEDVMSFLPQLFLFVLSEIALVVDENLNKYLHVLNVLLFIFD